RRSQSTTRSSAPPINSSSGKVVMRGQKRVEDARERAYDPRIHPLGKTVFARTDGCRVKPGNDRIALGERARMSLRSIQATLLMGETKLALEGRSCQSCSDVRRKLTPSMSRRC